MTKSALEGIGVLDVTQVLAGPFCTMMLADLGASVIKIEPPSGDSTRAWLCAVGTDSPSFNAVNRGKRSVVLNLKTNEGREVFMRLAQSADILIENFRPGVMASLGLDYASLVERNPRLIYASISAYGRTGPECRKGGFDLVAQGLSGIMSVTGEPGGPPVKAGVPLTDLGAGMFALAGILAALECRHRTGVGQEIETSLLDAGVAMSVWEATEYFSRGVAPIAFGSAHRMAAPYQAIRCADGYITLGAGNQRLFARLCEVLGRGEWATVAEFADNESRVRHRADLTERIETITTAHPRNHWLALFEAREIPCGPINDYSEVFANPQVLAREMVLETDHPTLGHIQTLGSPIKLSATPTDPSRRGPTLGEHTDEVLAEAGYSEIEIAELRRIAAVT